MNINDLQQLLEQIQTPAPRPPSFRAYYDNAGKIITYTCDDIPGNYILITPEQYAEARPDALVRNGKLVYTHRVSHTFVLRKNSSTGTPASKYDVNLVIDTSRETFNGVDHTYWNLESYEIEQDE